jgi:hypothetical protein
MNTSNSDTYTDAAELKPKRSVYTFRESILVMPGVQTSRWTLVMVF